MTIVSSGVSSASEWSTLEQILQRHEFGVATISSITCRYTLYLRGGPDKVYDEGNYTYSPLGTVVQRTDDMQKMPIKAVSRDGINFVKAPAQPPEPGVRWVVSRSPTRLHGKSLHNVRAHGLFTVPMDVDNRWYSAREYCERRRANFTNLRRDKIDGTNCIVAQFEYVDKSEGQAVQLTEEIWFAIEKNHLIQRARRSGGGNFIQWDVIQFANPSPNIFFPVQVRELAHIEGENSERVTLRVNQLRVNQPVDKNLFDTTDPPYATILDELAGKYYSTDSTGQQIGEATQLAFTPALLNPGGVSRAAGDAPPPTRREPPPRGRSLMLVGVGLMFLGAVLWLLRVWRNRSE